MVNDITAAGELTVTAACMLGKTGAAVAAASRWGITGLIRRLQGRAVPRNC